MTMRFFDARPPVVMLLCLSVAACFHSLDNTKIPCKSSDHCPSDYVCSAGYCATRTNLPGGSVDSGVSSDAPAIVDAGRADRSDTGSNLALDSSTPDGAGAEQSLDGPISSSDGIVDHPSDLADGLTGAGGVSGTGGTTASSAPPGGGGVAGGPGGSGGAAGSGGSYDAGSDVPPDLPYRPEVGPDVPITSCVIGGTTYASDAPNPANACQVCKPATSSMGWSNADEGTACNNGQFCNAGTCKTGCFVSGTFYATAAANPANGCQTCQPSFATTSWTTGANGASCGTGQVCNAGSCQSGCWIDGALVGSGTTNTSNACEICKPTVSTSTWSNNADGTNCGTGKICVSGTCGASCDVGGTIYSTGALNPGNGCQSCNPSFSTSTWYQVPSDCATIAAHDSFTCATSSGGAKCWGSNGVDSGGRGVSYSGLLGIGQSFSQTPYSATPVGVSGLGAGVAAVSTGGTSDHACAVSAGGVLCWGYNGSGQVGDGTTTDRNAPVPVTGLTSGVRGVATGWRHSCALLNGQVQCWGDNGFGQIGNDPSTTTESAVPVAVTLSGNIEAIALGANHSCALVSGSVWCWGDNLFGMLGNNSTTDSYLPVQTVGLGSSVQAIAAGSLHTCALVNGGVLCWGSNTNGRIGDGTSTDRSTPVQVQGLASGVQAIAVGDSHTCALVNGGVWCWGWNGLGQLGDNTTTDRPAPVAVQGLGSGVQAITAGYKHSCALTSAGAKCWGDNSSGQLGNNSTTSSLTPVSVQGI